MKKGQSAIEFIIIIGVVLLFFTLILGSVRTFQQREIEEEENQKTNEIAKNVKEEIEIASQTLDGYKREFKIPEKILGHDYSIEIIEGSIQIKSRENSLSLRIKEVNGEIKKGVNVIKRKNGEVYLNE